MAMAPFNMRTVCALVLCIMCLPAEGFFSRKRAEAPALHGKGRKVVFIFSKARSANSITSKLFDLNPDFLHFSEPFSAWRERRATERSMAANVDFMERLVDCRLMSEEVYHVTTQGAAVPEPLRLQKLPSTEAVSELKPLCANRNIAVKTIRQSGLGAICDLQRRLNARGDEVYVIDTYRDPRAVVATLLEAAPEALSNIPESMRVKKMSESACQHMSARYKADSRECKGLKKYSLQNEHFSVDPLHEAEMLYKFMGLKMPGAVKADLKKGVTADGQATGNGTEVANAPPPKDWHQMITRTQGAEVQAVCKRLMPSDLFKMVFVA